jgi:integrase
VGFEILLESSSFTAISEGRGDFDLPRGVGLRAWSVSPIVFGKSRFQVPGQANVVAIRVDRASKDIDVVETHGLLRRSMPALQCGLQSRSEAPQRKKHLQSCEAEPVVLDVKEVLAVLDKIDARFDLMARIQYVGGLRLMELVRLRVKDVDEARGIVTVRSGKGDKDRTTILPESLRNEVARRRWSCGSCSRRIVRRDWPGRGCRKRLRGNINTVVKNGRGNIFSRQRSRRWIRKVK